MTRQLATCGAAALPDLVAWFGWHDGTEVPPSTPQGAPSLSDDTCLFGVWHLPTLGQAAVLAGPVGSLFVWDPHAANDPFDLRAWYPNLTDMVAAMVAAYRHGRITPTQVYIDPDDLPLESRPLAY